MYIYIEENKMNDVDILENRFLEIIIKYPESINISDPRDFFDY